MALYYSCDSHVVEPPEVFEGLDKQFGSRAPYYVQDPDGKKGTYIVLGKLQMNVGRMSIAGGVWTIRRPSSAWSGATMA